MRTGVDRILVTHTGSLPRPVGVALPGTEAALAGGTTTSATPSPTSSPPR
jgi:hypothetical protein